MAGVNESISTAEPATQAEQSLSAVMVKLATEIGGDNGFDAALDIINAMAEHMPDKARRLLAQELRRHDQYATNLGEGGYAEYVGELADAIHPRNLRVFEGRARIAELFGTCVNQEDEDVAAFRAETEEYNTALTLEEVDERIEWARTSGIEGGWIVKPS